MKRILFALFALVVLSSHDMYLKLDGYFLPPNSQAVIHLYNGTFAESDNTIDRDRMSDISLLANGTRMAVDTNQWRDEGDITVLSFETGDPGTYVAGVSTRPRQLAMDAEAFNRYLEHDGVVDMLADREANGTLETDAVEKYSKHVKTIFQVGDTKTDDWKKPLGYPIEFVPMSNPYNLHAGDALEVQLLWQGAPLAEQLIIIDTEASDHGHTHAEGEDHEHSHAEGEDQDHTHTGLSQVRTDAEGKFTFDVSNDGSWFVRTIYMAKSEEEGLTHESNWATLTFGVDHGHSHAGGADHDHGHDHEHAHEHEGGLPSYAYWVGSLLLVGGLFFWFNRKA